MITVDQTRFGQDGNCMSACLATVFSLPLDQVPDLCPDHGDWVAEYTGFLKDRGLVLVTVDFSNLLMILLGSTPVIVSGKTECGLLHATVWRRGQLFHDPHPSRVGLTKPSEVDLYVLRYPAAAKKLGK